MNLGHVLLVPKAHHAHLADLPEPLAAHAASLLPRLCRAIQAATGADGLNVIINNGRAAGQTVDHGHWHLIPRFHGDPVDWPWPHSEYVGDELGQMQLPDRARAEPRSDRRLTSARCDGRSPLARPPIRPSSSGTAAPTMGGPRAPRRRVRPEPSPDREEPSMELSRRQFLQASAVGAVVAPSLGAGAAPKLPARPFGKTGLEVSILGFGSGSRFLMYQDEDKALEALGRALDLGITYIDTAHSYGNGKSEERIGKLMAARRKAGHPGHEALGAQGRRRPAPDRAEPQAAADRPPRRPAHPRALGPRGPGRDRGARRRPEGPVRGARPEGRPRHRHHLPRRPRRAEDGAGAARLRLHPDGPQRGAWPAWPRARAG